MTLLTDLFLDSTLYSIASQPMFLKLILLMIAMTKIEEFTVEWQYSYFKAEGGARAGVSSIPVV